MANSQLESEVVKYNFFFKQKIQVKSTLLSAIYVVYYCYVHFN